MRHPLTTRRFAALIGFLLGGLLSTPAAARSVSPLPADVGSIQAFRAHQGKPLYFLVTGAASGSLWGSNPYTDDSTLAAAAVHAGLLKTGQSGVIKVTPSAGLSSYAGSAANGLTSNSYGSYSGSFSVAADDGGDNPVLSAPSTLVGYRSAPPGSVYLFDVTGATSGSVWGTNAYTDDSTLAAAAVHAGVVRAGQRATLRVVIGNGVQSYAGSTLNGVVSSDYSSWKNNYAVSDSAGATALYAYPGMKDNPLPAPGNLSGYAARNGASLYFRVTGATSGSLWGTRIYTADSTLAKAAVHAGFAASGASTLVKATLMAGLTAYSGSTANGVSSSDYGSYSASYTLAAPDGDLGTIPKIGGTLSAQGTEGQAFSYAVTASPSPAFFEASGLPEGLSLDRSSGRISGAPKVSGVYRVQLLAGAPVGTSNAELLLTIAAAGTTPSTSSALTNSADCLFNWAERQYPEFFQPARPAAATQDGYYYRYYRTSNSYLVVSSTARHVHYIGALSANAPLDLGELATWLRDAGCPALGG